MNQHPKWQSEDSLKTMFNHNFKITQVIKKTLIFSITFDKILLLLAQACIRMLHQKSFHCLPNTGSWILYTQVVECVVTFTTMTMHFLYTKGWIGSAFVTLLYFHTQTTLHNWPVLSGKVIIFVPDNQLTYLTNDLSS